MGNNPNKTKKRTAWANFYFTIVISHIQSQVPRYFMLKQLSKMYDARTHIRRANIWMTLYKHNIVFGP
jgi:hypothetical protein